MEDKDYIKKYECYSDIDPCIYNRINYTISDIDKCSFASYKRFIVVDVINNLILFVSKNTCRMGCIDIMNITGKELEEIEPFINEADRLDWTDVCSKTQKLFDSFGINFGTNFYVSYDYRFVGLQSNVILHLHSVPLIFSKEGKPWIVLGMISPGNANQLGKCVLHIENKSKLFQYNPDTNMWGQLDNVNLTDRERKVLALTSQGLSTKELSSKLPYSEATLKKIKREIFQKTSTQSITEALTFCFNHNLM